MFGHEKLNVYQASIQYVAYVYDLANKLQGYHRHARDQLLNAFLDKVRIKVQGYRKPKTQNAA